MSQMSRPLVDTSAILARRARVVPNAEVVRVKQHGVAVRNIELLFVAKQLRLLLVQVRDEA